MKAASRKIRTMRRSVISSAQEDWVSVRPLFPDTPYPTLIEPRVEGLVLPEWGRSNKAFVEKLYHDHRSLLFRGFVLGGADGFGEFVDTISNGPRLPYMDRTTPRDLHGDNIYCTTIFPSAERMAQHNEGSYWIAWSLKAFFACITPPETGGETPITDVHEVYKRIDPEIRDEFMRKDWCFVRNFNDGFGLPWQEVFQTEKKAEVEAFCRSNHIQWEWKDANRLRTRQIRPAVRVHPKSGEPLWFNHIAFYNIASRPPDVRDAMLGDFAEEDLPFNTFYGDGTRIDPEVIHHINNAYDAEELMFRWQAGDVHLIDNMRLSHGRQPFTGERLILVALTEGYTGDADAWQPTKGD